MKRVSSQPLLLFLFFTNATTESVPSESGEKARGKKDTTIKQTKTLRFSERGKLQQSSIDYC